jgi:hypothetical protein
MFIKISPSRFSLLFESLDGKETDGCKRCFWLRENLDDQGKPIWKRPKSAFPGLPGAVDSKLKDYYDGFRKGGGLPPELKKEKDCNNLILWPNQKKLDEYRHPQRLIKNGGLGFVDSKLNSELHGGVDEVLMTNDSEEKLVVADYKTRSGPPVFNDPRPNVPDTVEYNRNQLNIYAFLLQKLGWPVENYGFLIYYYPKNIKDNGDLEWNTHLEKMDIDVNSAKKIWEDGINLIRGPCPVPGVSARKICDWCKDFTYP